jgi:HAD superfamily hydrolase (TIGR01509 family)
MIAALIFDFDGLLMDTETAALESWRSIYAEYGCAITLEMWQSALGSSSGFNAMRHLAATLAQRQPPVAFDQQDIRARRDALKLRLCASQPLMPGVLSLLDQADAMGLPCAVASSNSHAWVAGWLRHHAIFERFACLCTGDNVSTTKPAPDLFLCAAACMGVPAARCLVFEDAPNGIRAAHAAAMPCVAVPGPVSRQMPFPPTDLVLSSLDTMPLAEILRRIAQARPG